MSNTNENTNTWLQELDKPHPEFDEWFLIYESERIIRTSELKDLQTALKIAQENLKLITEKLLNIGRKNNSELALQEQNVQTDIHIISENLRNFGTEHARYIAGKRAWLAAKER